MILQTLDNTVDSVKEALPEGSTFWEKHSVFFDSISVSFHPFVFLTNTLKYQVISIFS